VTTIVHHRLSNHLDVLVEHVPNVRTAAIEWWLPAGVAYDPHDRVGRAAVLAEMVLRGAGSLNAKEQAAALDRLGISRQVSPGIRFMRLGGIMLGSRVEEGFGMLRDIVLNPLLPEESLSPIVGLCVQSLDSLSDDPAHLAMVELDRHHLSAPFNRSPYGDRDAFLALRSDDLRVAAHQTMRPDGAILSIAGDIDADAVLAIIIPAVSDWHGDNPEPSIAASGDRGMHFLTHDSAQTHLALAFDGPQARDADRMNELIAMMVFGGASSGRLFTEVRQRRSLCYSVYAQYAASRDEGTTRLYAGTTPQRADETAAVCLEQLYLLKDGISEEEFNRAKRRLLSRIVMRSESTTALAKRLAHECFAMGHARTLADIRREIEGATLDQVNAYLSIRRFGHMTLQTVGQSPITVPPDQLVDEG
jgi:predicted Zn-dependent peptidase